MTHAEIEIEKAKLRAKEELEFELPYIVNRIRAGLEKDQDFHNALSKLTIEDVDGSQFKEMQNAAGQAFHNEFTIFNELDEKHLKYTRDLFLMQPLELRWFMDTNEEVRHEHDDHLRGKTYAGIINYNFVESVVHEMDLGVYVKDLAKY